MEINNLNMRFIIASDIHCNFDKTIMKIRNFTNRRRPTAILLAGDLTNYGIREREYGVFKDLERLSQFMLQVASIAPLYYITGNHDIGLHEFELLRAPSTLTAHNVTDRSFIFGGEGLSGLNMSPCYTLPELALNWDRMTHNREAEEAYYESIMNDDSNKFILSHCPPSGYLGTTGPNHYRGKHIDIGSEPLRKRIEAFQPRLVVCGHNHSKGGKYEFIGNSLVINTATKVLQVDLESRDGRDFYKINEGEWFTSQD